MNRIKTTDVVDPSIQQPLTTKSLDFLQDANKETTLALATAFIGDNYDSTLPYILTGLDIYGTHQYHEGYVLYGGEVYYSAGKSGTTAFSNMPVMTITTTNDSIADPVTFTDGVARNVHNVRRMVLSDAVSGTGTFNLTAATRVQNSAKTYTPTLTATAIGGAVNSTGFTGTATGKYTFKHNTLNIYMNVTNVATFSTSVELGFTIPISVDYPYGAEGYTLVKYYDGSSYTIKQARIGLRHTGQGDGLIITNLDGSAFGTTTGGQIDFSITIMFRKDGE